MVGIVPNKFKRNFLYILRGEMLIFSIKKKERKKYFFVPKRNLKGSPKIWAFWSSNRGGGDLLRKRPKI